MKTLIGTLPLLLHAACAALCLAPGGGGLPGLLLAPLCYPVLLLLLAGGLARCVRHHVRRGRFDRDPATPLYRGRMIYGAAWTAIYYCKPVLHVLLSCPPLRKLLFRAFGYRGDLDFTIYPDTWIRDLCLLDFGPGTYVANRATLGTNHVRADGRILVAGITTGRGAIIGHLAKVGGGTRIGDHTELGVGSGVGFNVRIGDRVSIGPTAVVDGRSRIMDDVVIGAGAYVGKGCVIHAGVEVPAGAVITDRSVLRSTAEAVDEGQPRRPRHLALSA